MSTYSHSYQNPLVHRLPLQNPVTREAKPDCSSDEAIAAELSNDPIDHLEPAEPTAADNAAIQKLLASPPTPSVSARSSSHNAPLSSFARSAFEHQAEQAPFFFATGVEDQCTYLHIAIHAHAVSSIFWQVSPRFFYANVHLPNLTKSVSYCSIYCNSFLVLLSEEYCLPNS